jgi:chromosome segregation ATPase
MRREFRTGMSIARQFGGVRPLTFRGVHRASESNGGGGGGDVEARLARLEADVKHIDSEISEIRLDIRDIRQSLGKHHSDWMILMRYGVACAAALLTFGAVAYVKLSDRIDTLAAQTRTQFSQVNAQLESMDARFAAHFDRVNARMDEIHVRLDRTNERIDALGERLEAKIDALSGARRARPPAPAQ